MEPIHTRLINLVALCSEYCAALENSREMEKSDFVYSLLGYLPRIYFEFHDIDEEESAASFDEWSIGLTDHLDEMQYEAIRLQLAAVFGEDDTYLETFERDMKYSDSPIATTISENLADIYQPLYNFVAEVRESEGGSLEEAFRACKDAFKEYWSQTLCNVLRAVNNLEYRI